MAAGPIISWQIEEEKWKQWQILFSWALKPLDGDCSHEIKRHAPWKENYDKPRQCIKQQRHHFSNKSLYSESFSSSHVWMREMDYKEGWVPKNLCFQIVVLEKTLESPLHCKIKPVNPKGNQSWIFTGRTLILGKIEGKRRRGWQRMKWLDGITDSMDMIWAKSGG